MDVSLVYSQQSRATLSHREQKGEDLCSKGRCAVKISSKTSLLALFGTQMEYFHIMRKVVA